MSSSIRGTSGFEWAEHRGPFRRLTPEQVEQFDELGFVVLEDVLTDDELAPVVAEIDALDAATDAFLAERDGERFSIAERGAITFSLLPVLADDAARGLRRAPACSPISATTSSGPTSASTGTRRCTRSPRSRAGSRGTRTTATRSSSRSSTSPCWVALTDATLDNGCPQVVPGLHRLGTLRHHYVDPLGWEFFEDHPDAIAAPVGTGGIVVFSSLTPHLTGPNTTDAVRKAYILQYAPDGAQVFRGDAGLPKPAPQPADDPHRQFPVLVGGEPVAPPPR